MSIPGVGADRLSVGVGGEDVESGEEAEVDS